MIMKIDKSKAIHDAVMEEVEEKGIEKGRLKEKYNLALKLLTENFPIEKVADLTGLDLESVKKLKNEDMK